MTAGRIGTLLGSWRAETADRSEAAAIELDRQSVLPAALAAAAEAAVLFLPLKALAADAVDATGGPMLFYPFFLFLFVGAVALSTALRRFKGVPSAVAVGAVAVGASQALWGSRDLLGMVAAVVLALLLGIRVAMLALRDWRDPLRVAFGVGVGVLLGEVIIAAGGTAGWRPFLPALIGQFFLAGLGSRAASVRLANRPQRETVDEREPRRWLKASLVIVAGLGALLVVAALLGRQGGALQWVGQGVFRLGTNLIGWMAFLLAKALLRPLNWVITSLHFDLEPLSRAAENLEGFRRTAPRRGMGASALNRFLGLLFFVLFAVFLLRALRRYRELVERYRPVDSHEPQANATPYQVLRARRHRRRYGPELPEDTVRRWYAQALLSLQRLGLTKPPSETPDEYLRDVTKSVPACAAEFTVLTRAYEDVRYGNRRLEPAAIERLEPHRMLLMKTLTRMPRAEPQGVSP
jgi:hypothetical protein